MKKNPPNQYENYKIKIPIKHTEKKFYKHKSSTGNISFKVQTSFWQKNDNIPITRVNYQFSNQNKIFNNSDDNLYLGINKFTTSINKEFLHRENNETQPFKPNESYEEPINKTNLNLKPHTVIYQTIDENQNKFIRKNYKNNVGENNFPSNYAYYESKYTKKKKKEPEKNSKKIIISTIINHNNNFQNKNNQFYSNDKNNLSNISLNQNLNKSHLIEKNKNNVKNEINKSPQNKTIESKYYKIQKDKINNLVNCSSDNKRTIIFKKQYNTTNNIKNNINDKKNIQPYAPINNAFIKSKIQPPPHTPTVYSQYRVTSPIKKSEEINNLSLNNDDINKITSERDLPSKSLEKITFKKLIFNQPNDKNSLKYKKKIELSDVNKNIINEPIRLTLDNIPLSPKEIKVKNFTKINAIKNINDKNNTVSTIISNKNKVLITITNLKENKKIIKNNNINSSYNPTFQEHIKTQTHELKTNNNHSQNIVNEDKNLNNEKKKKKSMIQGIKLLNYDKIKKLSSVNDNNKTNNTIFKNKINDSEKISNRNQDIKSNILMKKIKSKNFEEDKDYFKEVSSILYENNTEPKNQIKYNFKDNNIDKNSKLNLSKGRSGNITEKNQRKNYGVLSIINNLKEKKKNENFDIKKNNDYKNNNNNYNTITTSNTNIHDNIKNRRNSSDIILNSKTNIININSYLKKNNSNSRIQVLNRRNIFNPEFKKDVIKKISTKKQNEKESNKSFNKLSLSANPLINSPFRKSKQKSHKYQTEFYKYESRVNRLPKRFEKKTKGNDEEWDKVQYMGMRKKTYDPTLRVGKKNKLSKKAEKGSSLNAEFSSTLYVKVSEGLSIPGKNEHGHKKTNQDTFIIEKNVNGVLNFNIFGVLDGHGEDGHFASQFVSRYILHRIKTHPSIKKEDEPKEIYYKLIANGYQIIANIFLEADIQIQKEKFNVTRSGTTCVLVIQLEEHIICANTGDSRAIMVYDENYDDNLVDSKVYSLSYDCKPELPKEKRRIYAHGGIVERAYDEEEKVEVGPFRVWAKGEDYPGLAMSRSIGDMDAKRVGVIPNPQIVEYTIDYFSKYLIVASDGIWEFISNEQVMKYSNKYYLRNDPIGLCHELSQKAISLWEKNDCVIDDITIIVVFL